MLPECNQIKPRYLSAFELPLGSSKTKSWVKNWKSNSSDAELDHAPVEQANWKSGLYNSKTIPDISLDLYLDLNYTILFRGLYMYNMYI